MVTPPSLAAEAIGIRAAKQGKSVGRHTIGVNYYAHINKLPHFVIKFNIFGGNFSNGGRVANASYMTTQRVIDTDSVPPIPSPDLRRLVITARFTLLLKSRRNRAAWLR